MILNDEQIKRLVTGIGLVKDYIDLDIQLQSNGFDVTIQEIYKLNGKGVLDFDNSKRKLPERELIEFDKNGKVKLKKGAYIIKINEVVNIPKDMCALIFPRSSLLRMGCQLYTAVWDAGYTGKGEILLEVYNPSTLYKNARIGQIIFLKLISNVDKGYDGIYQNKE